MDNLNLFFSNIYNNFNDRNIDLIIHHMTDDVQWANGMEGGYVHGHDGVRAYWLRQFQLISSNVTPLKIDEENDTVKIRVHQIVYDKDGNLLTADIVFHYFTLKNEKIARFDIDDLS